MINDANRGAADTLKSAFEAGFLNASRTLGQFIKDAISFNNFDIGHFNLEGPYLTDEVYSQHSRNANILLTTEIFGDITGKSYLFLSEAEFELLTGSIPDSKNPAVNLKEEFIKELDNMLSAAVITKLSNELKKKMYGDVPVFAGKVRSKVADTIYDDFSEQTSELYINSAFFTFEKHPELNPLFIWAVDTSILENKFASIS